MATKSNPKIRRYQQNCFRTYSETIGLPKRYRYPTGNPIRPLPPVQTTKKGVMIVGAYPSARFESRPSTTNKGRRRLIPVADNLKPFGIEVYFDGTRIRELESGAGLQQYILEPLGVEAEDCWITDLVKVFLYKNAHAGSCGDAVPGFRAPVYRDKFMDLAEKSLPWLLREIELCEPKYIITLGSEVARAVSGSRAPNDKLLSKNPTYPEALGGLETYHMPHPEACRRDPKWARRAKQIARVIRKNQ